MEDVGIAYLGMTEMKQHLLISREVLVTYSKVLMGMK